MSAIVPFRMRNLSLKLLVLLDNDSLYLEDAAANLDFTLSEKERNSEEDVACCISSGSWGDLCLLSTGHYFSGNKANLYQCLRLLGALKTLM
jgi:hypothetical protein